MNDNDTPDWLKPHLASLPQEIAPARDLWPDIARRLAAPRQSRVMVFAAAASVIVGVSATFFTWRVFEQQRQEAAALLAARQLLEQIREPYLPVRAGYEARWPELRAQLDPDTARVVEQNLEIIRNANAELARALERQPDSPVLRQLLRQTMAQELDVYRRVESAGRPAI
jgi:hypothetical protein